MKVLLCSNSIVISYFDTDYFDYLLDYIYFMRSFVNFFVLVICLYNLSYKVIGFVNNLNYLEVVFQSCYYYVCFCLVLILFHVLVERFIWFFVLLWFVLVILLLLPTFGNAVSVSSAKIAPFFERWFTFEIWIFLIYVKNFSDFFQIDLHLNLVGCLHV